ncbi:Protein translocase subunit SecA [bioreactor metagenome]|uniref:Protein translocase subunit SecA n=2 Tax=root TaxID=1 RepID=A0A645HG98_9ZZZZ
MEQRRLIYTQRDEILAMDNITDLVKNLYGQFIDRISVNFEMQGKTNQAKVYAHELLKKLNISEEIIENGFNDNGRASKIWMDDAWRNYEEIHGEDKQLEKMVFLTILDRQWMEHVDNMDRVKKGIYLRQYASIKPVDAFKEEAVERFENMMDNITEQTVLTLASAPKQEGQEED